jgi:hypothetical protein
VEDTDMMSWFPEEFSLVATRAELDPTDALTPRALFDDDADDRDEAGDPSSEALPPDTRGLHWTRALLEACQDFRSAED